MKKTALLAIIIGVCTAMYSSKATSFRNTPTVGSPISSFVITVKDGDLYGEADSYGANKLLKQAEEDKFVSTSSYGSTIIFTRDATKKVNGLQLIIQGNTLEATRDK
jgi:hypothetical protein